MQKCILWQLYIKICLFQGIQLFTVVRDVDDQPGSSGSVQLVDQFSIDLTTSFLIPGAGFTAETFYSGFFGFGMLQLSFNLSCAANFFGSDCATECVPNDLTVCDENGISVCRPGRFGDSCEFFDNCFENDQCDPNGECVDGDDTFTCECNAGFTGADCTTDINDCEGVDCGNGACRDTGVNAFTCECNAGFTGADAQLISMTVRVWTVAMERVRTLESTHSLVSATLVSLEQTA